MAQAFTDSVYIYPVCQQKGHMRVSKAVEVETTTMEPL